MDNYPIIQVSFSVEGQFFDLEDLTQLLKVVPTETRNRDAWPDSIKKNKMLPEKLQPRTVWSIVRTEENCVRCEIPIREIMEILKDKEAILINYCDRNELEMFLIVVIHGKTMELPEMQFHSDVVSYFGNLGVEIGINVYTY